MSTTLGTSQPLTRASSTEVRFWLDLLTICGFGLALRLLVAVVWLGSLPMHGDAADYFSEAVGLHEGTREAVAYYWPPGTTYLLATLFKFTGPSETAARVLMAVLGSLQILVIGWLGRELTGQLRTGRVAAWIAALYPPVVLFTWQCGSQHLSAFCLTMVALYGLRTWRFPSFKNVMLLGLTLGLGCLARPSMLSIVAAAPLLAAWLWFKWSCVPHEPEYGTGPMPQRPKLWVAAAAWAAALTIAALCLAPTALYNARHGGGWTLSTNNERNFFIGNNPHTPWYKTGHMAQRQLSELSPDAQTYLKAAYAAPNRRARMSQLAWEHIRQEPALFVLRTANRARAFWGFDYIASRTYQASLKSAGESSGMLTKAKVGGLLLLEAGGYLAVMLLATAGLLAGWNQQRSAIQWWLLGLTVMYAAPYGLAFAAGTYHFPVIGLLIPFAAIGWTTLANGHGPQAFLTRVRQTFWQHRATFWATCLLLAVQAEYLYFAVRYAD